MTDVPKLAPLKITCTSTSCNEGLHCFRPPKGADSGGGTLCRSCGADLIDWPRVHARDLADIAHTFESLRRELIRHHFWHVDFDEHAVNYALRKGSVGLQAATRHLLERAVGPAEPFRDGYQTPREGSRNPIHYAQHATASCCRACLAEWHGLEAGRALSATEIDYLTTLCMRFLVERLPALSENGVSVPPIRTPIPDDEHD